jgi:hypothetical protein
MTFPFHFGVAKIKLPHGSVLRLQLSHPHGND